ncbi:MAG: hypothetical protein EBR09_08085 [Proteobacteria bacterium]|nr:hypothetical protein [Pseudomonadota bacterium]
MALRPVRYSVALCTALAIVSGCGRNDDFSEAVIQSENKPAGAEDGLFFADTSTIQDVSLRDKDGASTIVTPSYLPKAGQSAVELELIFYPRLSVPSTSRFVYDKSKWVIVVGKNNHYVTGADILEIKEDGSFSSGEIREGQIKMRIRLTTQPQWPDKFTSDGSFDTVDGRKALKIQPYYSLDGAVPPGNSGTIQGLSATYMKDDIGAIVAPATVGSTVVSDGAFSFDFLAPADKTATDTSGGTPVSVGKSNVSGFVVVYWKDSECAAGGWTFKPNKVFDKTKGNADLSCTYPGIASAVAGTTSCNLGCSADVNSDFFDKSANDIAIPPEFPASNGTANAIKRGCLNIVRVSSDGRTSYAVNDAINNEKYGMMVYPLDSAGNIGMSRSKCLQAQSFNVGFASTKKSPGLGKSKSDCFVATAASGSPHSAAVHYWRVLRDAWLDRAGVTPFYYKHAPRWAAWLDNRPALKPYVNSILEWSGRTFVKLSQWLNILAKESRNTGHQALKLIENTLFPQAFASESASPEKATNAEEGLAYPFGSASTTLTIAGGQIIPTEDKELYDLSYKGKKPGFMFVAQSFRLFDASGEMGVGYEFGGVSMRGKSTDVNKTEVALSGYGGGALAEYRLRFGEQPWVSPRFSAVFGMMRMREEAASVSGATSTTGGTTSGTAANTKSEISPSGTTPVWHKYFTLRGTLDISVTQLHGDDSNLIRYGYEAEDMTLSLFAGLHSNNGQVISTSGLQVGGGISFLFR